MKLNGVEGYFLEDEKVDQKIHVLEAEIHKDDNLGYSRDLCNFEWARLITLKAELKNWKARKGQIA